MRKRGNLIKDSDYRVDPQDSSQRTRDVDMVVLHCTGGGIVQKAIDKIIGPKPTSVQLNALVRQDELSHKVVSHAADFYRAVNGVSTHYVIGWRGEILQCLDEDRRAWSAGIDKNVVELYKKGHAEWSWWERDSNKRLFKTAPHGFYGFWDNMYRDMLGLPFDAPIPAKASPLTWTGGAHGPDGRAISIDMLSPPYQRPGRKGPALDDCYYDGHLYTKAQFFTLRLLLADIAEAHKKFKMSRATVLPHSFTSPIERVLTVNTDGGKHGYGYDPGRLDWPAILGVPDVE